MREVDTGGAFLGHKLRLPVLLCPIGSLESFHPNGPRASMQAAADFGVSMFLSSISSLLSRMKSLSAFTMFFLCSLAMSFSTTSPHDLVILEELAAS